MSAIRSRKPTGAVPYPFILLEGEEKAGKTYTAALFTCSSKIGKAYWIDLGEGAADEYAAIKGTKYEVIEHDGTWAQIIDQVDAVRAEAARAKVAGEPPVVLIIDTMTDEWEGLKDWVTDLARDRLRRRGRQVDPTAEVQVTNDLWNLAASRHRKLMTKLLTFPGIVIATARGKDVAEIKDGKPVEGAKVWKVEGQKGLAFDATVWVRMTRTRPPEIVGARSVHAGVKPGSDEPRILKDAPDNLLEWLTFDVLKVDPVTAHTRDLRNTSGGALTDDERLDLQAEQQAPPRTPARVPAQRRPSPARSASTDQQAPTPTDDSVIAPSDASDAAVVAARKLALVAAAEQSLPQLQQLYRSAGSILLRIDITSALTTEQRAYVKDTVPVKLGTWLVSCAKHVGETGDSVDTSINLDPANQKEASA